MLALPLVAWWSLHSLSGLSKTRRITAICLRTLILLLVILALAEIKLVSQSRDLFVYYILDLSNSMPEGAQEKACQYIKETTSHMSQRDRCGLIVFGRYSSIEYQPDLDKRQTPLDIRRIDSSVSGEYTNIAAALRLAAGSFPENYRKRMVLISDGAENIDSAMKEASFAKTRGVQLCVLPVGSGVVKDVLVERLIAPDEVKEKEPFEVKTVVYSTHAGKARLRIRENGSMLADQEVELKPGRNVFICPRIIESSSSSYASYEATIEPLGPLAEERVPENNRAHAVTMVRGKNRVLFVEGEQEPAELLSALLTEGIAVQTVKSSGLPRTLTEMQSYDAIILCDVPRRKITEEQDALLEAAVRDMGVGLVMIGGDDSFGAGDYLGTAVERALPVSMDIKERKIMPSGALVLIMHTCEFPDGNTWAKKISQKAIEVLNENDYAGLLFYDGSGEYKWLFPLEKVGMKTHLFNLIRNNLAPMDMPDFEPTLSLAYKALKNVQTGVKHIVIVSDGDPSPAGDLLLDKMKEAKITISTVTIFPHQESLPPEMVRLVEKTRVLGKGGECYWPKNPEELPQIFIKEAKVVKRSLISEGEFFPRLASVTEVIRGLETGGFPVVRGYVLTSAKPRAQTPLLVGGELDPLLSHWYYGVGKSLAFTSDAAGRWNAAWISWDKFRKFWSQSIRWVSRSLLETDFSVSTALAGEKGTVTVNAVAKSGRYINLSEYEPLKNNFPGVKTWSLKARITSSAVNAPALEVPVRQTGPGRYEGEFEAGGEGANFVYVYLEGLNEITNETEIRGIYSSGLVIPYSLEYRPHEDGGKILEEVAAETDGKILSGNFSSDGSAIFNHSDLPAVGIPEDAWPTCLLLAFLVLPVDVFVRRVYIDWAKLRAGVTAFFAGFFRRREAKDTEGRIQRLLALKDDLKKKEEKMKEEYQTRQPPPSEKKAETTTEREPILDEMLQKELGAGGKKDFEKPPSKSAPQTDAKHAGSAFTSRLLEAKKRALKDRDKDKSGDKGADKDGKT
jgi:uncharacterized membrane protein